MYVRNTEAKDIDVFDSTQYLRYVDFDLGEEVRDALLQHGDNMDSFCKSTFNYIIELSPQMKERFHNFQHPVYDVTDCLQIENALSKSYRQRNPTKFPKLISKRNYSRLQSQWDDLPNTHLSKEITLKKSIIEFYIFIMNLENNEGVKPYFELAEFVLHVLTTPHADPERTFSDRNNCKTKNRNPMYVPTVESSVQVRQLITLQEDFEPTEEMIDMALNSNFYTY